MENMDWLEEELGGYDDDYLIIDCPGTLVDFEYQGSEFSRIRFRPD